MEQNLWKNTFGKLKMPEESKEKIWKELNHAEISGKIRTTNKDNRHFPPHCRPLKWALAGIAVCFIGITAANFQTKGKIVEAFQKLWKVEKDSQKIVEHTVDYHITLDGEFAPNLIECSEKRIVFASSIGLIIYDREMKRVVGTVDLQEIESNYFDDSLGATRFLLEENMLTIYNRKDSTAEGKGYIVSGNCYAYDLTECSSVENGEIKALKPVEIAPATEKLQQRWKETVRKSRKNVFNEYKGMEDIFEGRMHSRYSLHWKASNQKDYSSCLVIAGTEKTDMPTAEYQIMIYHKDLETNEVIKENLELMADMPEASRDEKLPEYEYTGNDLLMKALTDCARDNWKVYCGYNYSLGTSYVPKFREEAVILPVIHIYQIKEGEKNIQVYGLFTYMDVVRHKSMLYDSDGCGSGNRLGCAYLEKTSDGYKVKKIVHPLDGNTLEDMTALCGGDKKMAEKLVHHDSTKDREKEEIRLLREYVDANQLNIHYYKASAANPVKLDKQ